MSIRICGFSLLIIPNCMQFDEMSVQLENTTQALRDAVLAGNYDPGVAIREQAVAESQGVSRTLARLAMGALEREGLLTHEPNRGFRVRAFSVDEVADAIEVRGELEALAARQAAERGIPEDLERHLRDTLAEAAALMESLARGDEEARTRWIQLNVQFHHGIVEASANRAIMPVLDSVSRIPLAGPQAIVFTSTMTETVMAQVRAAHSDHEQILDAIVLRQGTRAASLIREHAYRSSRNKRQNFEEIENTKSGPLPAGLTLIRRHATG